MNCPNCDTKRPAHSKGIRNGKRVYKCRDCNKQFREEIKDEPSEATLTGSMESIAKRYSPEEIRLLAKGRMINAEQHERPVINFDGEDVVIGFCTDTHWGTKYSPKEYWTSFLDECKAQGVSMILHAGDVTEGMSGRPDHVYSLTHVGFSAQIDYAVEMFSMTDLPIYCIDGNHDRWGIKPGGVMVVSDIAKRCKNVTYLGHDEADMVIKGSVWRLFHGEDGSSYASSYRVQKLIESFTGGAKPNVCLVGHTHKQIYIFERNVHAVSGGVMCRQSAWMRSKKLVNHDGFHIIRATIRDGQVVRFSPTFYPFFN